MKQIFIITVWSIAVACVIPSKASEPDVRIQIMADLTDSIKIADRPDIAKPYIDDDIYLRDTTYNLNLPLVIIKNKKLKDKLSNFIMNDKMDFRHTQYLYLEQETSYSRKDKGKVYSLWELAPNSNCSLNIGKYSVGYCQIDSIFVIIDESAKSKVKMVKGYNKDFSIKVCIYKPPYFTEPRMIHTDK